MVITINVDVIMFLNESFCYTARIPGGVGSERLQEMFNDNHIWIKRVFCFLKYLQLLKCYRIAEVMYCRKLSWYYCYGHARCNMHNECSVNRKTVYGIFYSIENNSSIAESLSIQNPSHSTISWRRHSGLLSDAHSSYRDQCDIALGHFMEWGNAILSEWYCE